MSTNPAATDSHRIALSIEYDGSNFAGWQSQSSPNLATIQQAVEAAVSKIADHEVTIRCAGRTDAGVHATCQVIHFDCALDRGRKAWTTGSNSLLPSSIRVTNCWNMDALFHARHSAVARRYYYVIFERKIATALLANRVTQIPFSLDAEAMHEGAQYLLGEKDFSSFRAAGCQSSTANRKVISARVIRQQDFVILDIKANAFLQHMVRNITGALLEVGQGIREPEWIGELLQLRDRSKGAVTAPPHGLYLVGVEYPKQFALETCLVEPPFLQLTSEPD